MPVLIEPRIDWKKYPRLAACYQHRPDTNVHAQELKKLLDATPFADLPAILAKLERLGIRETPLRLFGGKGRSW